jgi:hypothetical protein
MPNTTEQGKVIMENLRATSTYDLAFRLAFNQFESELERTLALTIIQERDFKPKEEPDVESSETKTVKPPLKGSKTEKIFNLFD